jgi:hypothetical protein
MKSSNDHCINSRSYTNMSNVRYSGVDQFYHETQTWERTLDFYKQENAFLKTRLSEVVDNNSDKIFLALAEHFNNRFLFMDEYIKEFRKDIRMQVTMIKESLSGNHLQDKVLNNLQAKLRKEMDLFEKDVYVLKTDFNKKLVSYLGIN